jgi:hypothetical protein
MAGTGASFLIIPVLLAYDYSLVVVGAYGLLFNFINTSTASVRHFKHKSINFKIAIPIIVSSMIGAPIGANMVNLIPEEELRLVFSIALIIIGLNMLKKTITHQVIQEDKIFEVTNSHYLISAFIGLFVGFVFGLLGIGGGAITLILLLSFGLQTKKAAGTASFVIVFSALFGFISKVVFNEIEFDFVVIIGGAILSVLGAIIGSYTMHFKLKPKQIKLIISIMVILVGTKMIIDYL